MTKKTQTMLRRLIPYAAVLLIGALIVVGVIVFAGKSKIVPDETNKQSDAVPENGDTDDEEQQSVIEIDTESTETKPTEPSIAAVDQVNVDSLIDRFYDAKIDNDAEELNKIVDTDEPFNEADLVDETQFISRYDNFRTYVIPGITDNYFVVYVKYDIFFNGINTGAPSLNHFIVVKDEDGHYYIYSKEVSGEFQTYIEQTEQSEIVQGLKEQVERELKEACDANEDLKYLISMLNGDKEKEDNTDIHDYDGASTEAPETSESRDEQEETDGESESFETQEFTEDPNS
ncbi:MAG: hypothetical protein IJL78_04490 [Lachnospiraceae bacterium]|nr:hypothetical protein [Lachnospiraceae bacterium]